MRLSLFQIASRSVRVIGACVLLACTACLAAEASSPPSAATREKLTVGLEAVTKPWTGDLDGMIKRRLIRVLTVYNKTYYTAHKGVQRGLVYEFGSLFEKDLNAKLKKSMPPNQKHLKVRVVFMPMARGDMLKALAEGKGDIAAANLTITPERQKLVDFSKPTYPGVSEVLVSGPSSPAVSSVDDLSGKRVFVRKSSSYYESLATLNRRFATEKKPLILIEEAPDALEDEDLMEMVNAGLIPLTVVDSHIANFWKQIFLSIQVNNEIVVRTGGDIAWAFRKDSPQLKESIDDFVVRHGKGTTAGNTLLARYLKSTSYLKDAASEAERKKFLDLIQFFRKYGDQYDVDWLLMAAQGYQESQLNQEARSRVGAIGVMQVMPATAKDLKVGDISQVEPNIHAGIKYMRWMIDHYYGKEPMTKLDKALFAFASYNAGAGRISQLRREAEKRGLNPNVWFHNVEYVAAEKIGPETVTYVSNIYKYYVAYNLLMKAKDERDQATDRAKSGELKASPSGGTAKENASSRESATSTEGSTSNAWIGWVVLVLGIAGAIVGWVFWRRRKPA